MQLCLYVVVNGGELCQVVRAASNKSQFTLLVSLISF